MGEALVHGGPLEPGTGERVDLAQALRNAAAGAPDRAVVTLDAAGKPARCPYPELLAKASAVQARLRGLGAGPGDPIVLSGLPLSEFFPAFWGCVLGGALPVPMAGAAEDDTSRRRLKYVAELLGDPLVLVDGTAPGLSGLRLARVSTEPMSALPELGLHSPAPDDPALVMLSSGSTGAAKAIPLTHRGLMEFAAGSREALGLRPDDTTLNWLPVDHSGALLLYHVLEVYSGVTNVHVPTELVLGRPSRWLDLLAEYRVAHSWSPTFGFAQVAAELAGDTRDRDLSSVRTLVCGGEQIQLPVMSRFLEQTARFGIEESRIRPVWGMTETVTAITFGSLGTPDSVHRVLKSSLDGELREAPDSAEEHECSTFVAVGSPAPGASVRVVDDRGELLREREIGRLQVRSARVTPGYLHAEEANRAAFPAPGWLDTGDLAFLANGQVVLTGRAKDLIILNGQNHFCHEIEEVVCAAGGAQAGEVAAVGLPNAESGTEDLVILMAARAAGFDAVAKTVREAVFGRLRLTVAKVVPVAPDEFPRTGGGKVQRAELRRRLLAGELGRAGAGDVRATILAAVREVLGQDVDPRTPFYEAGMTSVTVVRLTTTLTALLGREVRPTLAFEYPTPALLADHLSGQGRVKEPSVVAAPAHDDRIAIIGVAVRLPGATDLDGFWADLRDGVSRVRTFDGGEPGVVPVAGALDDVDSFDADFFGMSPHEAALTAPAHRLFLECCHEALESGGYAAAAAGTRIGVFAGTGMQLYGHQRRVAQDAPPPAPDELTAMQTAMGTEPDFLAGRVAHRLGLSGPAVGVQTACSTGLVALHLAGQALLTGDADLALAGAAAVHLPQDSGYRPYPGGILSPTGACRAFDAGADGTVGGNGVIAVLLKRLDRAIADRDTVHAVILGSAVNNDAGRTAGFATPSVSGQADVVRLALARARVAASSVTYVEAHGTGTALGDPVEFEALSQAYAEDGHTGFCALGSVKPGIGHLDTCAGLAGLVKTVLMLKHGELVPTLNLNRPNPELRLAGSPFVLATEHTPWITDGPRRAGVSALGVGGTNVHVILEQAPLPPPAPAARGPVLLPVSAVDAEGLSALTVALRDHLRAHPDLRAPDVAASMALGRPHRSHRLAVVGSDTTELAAELGAISEESSAPHQFGTLAFAFSGQGAAYRGMAARLRDTFPVFRETLDELLGLAEEFGAAGVADALLGTPDPAAALSTVPTAEGQPALFCHQFALARLWLSWGVRPDFVVGHSLGEYAALAAAGGIAVADGLRLTCLRGRLMQGTEAGGMIAVRVSPERGEHLAVATGTEVAVVNGDQSCVLSGPSAAIAAAETLLDRENLSWQRLPVDRAFHSALLDPVLDEFERAAEAVRFGPLRMPFASNLGGVIPAGASVDARYLRRQIRETARFDESLRALERADCGAYLEIGPREVLGSMGRAALPHRYWQPSVGSPPDDECAAVLRAAAALYRRGTDLDWAELAPDGRRVPLPGYPYRRVRFARPSAPAPSGAGQVSSGAVLAEVRRLAADRLGADDLPEDTSFVAGGADSLALMGLARELERAFGVRIGIRELLSEAGTPAKVAELIERSGGAPPALGESEPEPGTPVEDVSLHGLMDRQLKLAETMMSQMTELMHRQLDVARGTPDTVAAAPKPVEHPVRPAAMPVVSLPEPATPGAGCAFSLYFFGDYPDRDQQDKYRLIMAAARFADEHDFHALWLPERHFDSFGALFPNPSVLAAALAARTERIRLHAGSVVLPLHHPVRVAEEWSVVDNLSSGRVGLCVASGWHTRDFALAPENFGNHRDLMYEGLETVRRLWAGEEITLVAGDGEPAAVRLHPAPIQRRPPMFVAVVGNPDSYRRAAAADLGVVTNLMTQDVSALADNIALYRRTRAEHGLDPGTGRVVVLVHTFLGADHERARQQAFRPFCDYLRSSLSLLGQVGNSLGLNIDLDGASDEDIEFMLGDAYERYCGSRALIGSPERCAPVVDALVAAGADEIAAFVDFGVPPDQVLDALPLLDGLRRRYQSSDLEPSPAQRRIWFLERMFPGTGAYHEPKAIRLDGRLDDVALRESVSCVVSAHPALRTVFHERDGVPRKSVLPSVTVECPLIDLSGRTEAEALAEIRARFARTRLALDTGPLVAFALVRLAEDRHLFCLVAHHIVFDSASTAVFLRDLAAHYRAWPGPPAIRTGPVPETEVEIGDPGEDLAFWRDELGGLPELALPTDRPRPPVPSRRGAALTDELAAGLGEPLRAVAAACGSTVFMVVLGAIGAVLGRYGGQRDFAVGTVVSSRPDSARDAIGLFLDTVPVRLDLSGDPTFAESTQRVRDRTTRAYEHRTVPFDELVGLLNPDRAANRNPLFDVLIEFENAVDEPFAPPLTATALDMARDEVPFDLAFYLTAHGDGVRCLVEYSTDLFDEATITRALNLLKQVLRQAIAKPSARLSELTTPTREDVVLLDRWQHGAPERTAGCLHAAVERQVASTPDATALISDDGELSYRELDLLAEAIGRLLVGLGVTRGQIVAVSLPRGPQLIAALYGVLKSGAAYLPLDPRLPPQRCRFMLRDSGAVLVLTTKAVLVAQPALGEFPVRLAEEIVPDPKAPELPEVRPDWPAYCMYTSGSTGTPKGVLVSHRGPANVIAWQRDQHPPMRTLQWTSPSFDISVQEIFSTLAAGGALVLLDDERHKDRDAVAEVIERHRVERILMPFTPLKHLVEPGLTAPSLRLILCCGEPLVLTPALRRFLAEHPDCALHNQYGPTEASIIATDHPVDPDGEPRPPIGAQIDGVRLLLLDQAGLPVPLGAIGEIHLGGAGLAEGYLGRPEETAAAFVEARPGERWYRTGDLGRWRGDGTLEFLGRLDDQVKIRGNRVEPGETQRVLAALDEVADAAVVVRRDHRGDAELAGYVVFAGPSAPDPWARITEALAEELPSYLIPTRWVALDRLPTTTSGKLDRSALPEPTSTAVEGDDALPSTDTERRLHALWCAELGLSEVAVDRSFFAVGGHSLAVVRLAGRITEEFEIPVSVTEFFRAPTIRAMAARLCGPPEPAVTRTVPLTSLQRRLWRRQAENPRPQVYNVGHRVDLRGELDPPALHRALDRLVARHDALRGRVALSGDGPRIEVLAPFTLDLPVEHLGTEGAIGDWCGAVVAEPFVLTEAPLLRARLGRIAVDRWVLVLVLHHLVCDGWSMNILWHELSELYAAEIGAKSTPLAEPEAQHSDYARWQTGNEHAADVRHWRSELADADLRWRLPYDRKPPARPSGKGDLYQVYLAPERLRRIDEVAAAAGTTRSVLLASVFLLWARETCGQQDLVLAVSSARRTRREHERTVGMIGEAVPLRVRLGETEELPDVMAAVAEKLFASLDHQELPLDETIALARQGVDRYPAVLFTVVTTPPSELNLPGLSATVHDSPVAGCARTELYLVFAEDEAGLRVTFEYSTDLFDAATIGRFAQDILRMLECCSE
ncbi:non-ribosomal peptide synthetase [Amycolatopsis sp. WAC 01375]|uniref:non-ribosomal peptide synthetase/type I polyketide synthase n=1 Tax=Amycolatopsis sp. WAC 01375 TaxID=2203194 RepID=UPI000F767BEF|nr:non-ribosomal peptide synthetase/type I polyketide synthase [Amycolatopsis sp. WAC 01375]RSM73383.1 non-ribosomal peptide synthetase [Amycolatopsis sp. WAC 01375]